MLAIFKNWAFSFPAKPRTLKKRPVTWIKCAERPMTWIKGAELASFASLTSLDPLQARSAFHLSGAGISRGPKEVLLLSSLNAAMADG